MRQVFCHSLFLSPPVLTAVPPVHASVPQVVNALFGVPSVAQLDPRTAKVLTTTELGARVNTLLEQLRSSAPLFPRIYIIREGDPLEVKWRYERDRCAVSSSSVPHLNLRSFFIEDRTQSQPTSYYEFLLTLQKEVNAKASSSK